MPLESLARKHEPVRPDSLSSPEVQCSPSKTRKPRAVDAHTRPRASCAKSKTLVPENPSAAPKVRRRPSRQTLAPPKRYPIHRSPFSRTLIPQISLLGPAPPPEVKRSNSMPSKRYKPPNDATHIHLSGVCAIPIIDEGEPSLAVQLLWCRLIGLKPAVAAPECSGEVSRNRMRPFRIRCNIRIEG